MLISSGALPEEEAKVSAIMAEEHCDFDGFADFNKMRTYANSSFRNDLIHLFDYGWEQRYAVDISKYLHGLIHPAPPSTPEPAIGTHAIETTGAGRGLPERP
jgi:hypothetical protein